MYVCMYVTCVVYRVNRRLTWSLRVLCTVLTGG